MKEFSLESLVTWLRIKDETRKHDQNEKVNAVPRKKPTNVLKQDLKPKGNRMKVQNRAPNNQKNSHKPQSRRTKQIMCFNCNKPEHLARNYRNRNRSTMQVNLIEEDLVAMIIETYVINRSLSI